MPKRTARRSTILGTVCVLAGLSAGCAEEDVPGTCTPACPVSFVCDVRTGACVPETHVDASTTEPPPEKCTAGLTACGSRCVDLSSDSTSCGECGKACRSAQSCQQSRCVCDSGWFDCNSSPSDGCECAGGCEGTACSGAPPTACDPEQEFDCGADNTERWCNFGACETCPAGKHNCDGLDDCESSNACCTPRCTGKCSGAPDDCGGTCTNNECAGCCTPAAECMPGDTYLFCGKDGKACVECTGGYSCGVYGTCVH